MGPSLSKHWHSVPSSTQLHNPITNQRIQQHLIWTNGSQQDSNKLWTNVQRRAQLKHGAILQVVYYCRGENGNGGIRMFVDAGKYGVEKWRDNKANNGTINYRNNTQNSVAQYQPQCRQLIDAILFLAQHYGPFKINSNHIYTFKAESKQFTLTQHIQHNSSQNNQQQINQNQNKSINIKNIIPNTPKLKFWPHCNPGSLQPQIPSSINQMIESISILLNQQFGWKGKIDQFVPKSMIDGLSKSSNSNSCVQKKQQQSRKKQELVKREILIKTVQQSNLLVDKNINLINQKHKSIQKRQILQRSKQTNKQLNIQQNSKNQLSHPSLLSKEPLIVLSSKQQTANFLQARPIGTLTNSEGVGRQIGRVKVASQLVTAQKRVEGIQDIKKTRRSQNIIKTQTTYHSKKMVGKLMNFSHCGTIVQLSGQPNTHQIFNKQQSKGCLNLQNQSITNKDTHQTSFKSNINQDPKIQVNTKYIRQPQTYQYTNSSCRMTPMSKNIISSQISTPFYPSTPYNPPYTHQYSNQLSYPMTNQNLLMTPLLTPTPTKSHYYPETIQQSQNRLKVKYGRYLDKLSHVQKEIGRHLCGGKYNTGKSGGKENSAQYLESSNNYMRNSQNSQNHYTQRRESLCETNHLLVSQKYPMNGNRSNSQYGVFRRGSDAL